MLPRTLIIIGCIAFPAMAGAAEHATGRDFVRQLRGGGRLHWRDNPVRGAFAALSEAYKVSILVDRRVPTDTALDYQCESQPLLRSLGEIATAPLGWTTLGSTIVIGPQDVTLRLPSLAAVQRARLSTLPPLRRAALSRSSAFRWERLSRPREIADQLAKEAKLEISNLDQIPHDLWPAASLPPLPWSDRMTLLLNSFDLMLKVDDTGNSATVVPIPAVEQFTREHESPLGGRVDLAALKRAFPELSITRVRNAFRVKGDYAAHDRVAKWILREATLPPPSRPRNVGRTRRNTSGKPIDVYSLKIDDQPVGGVLKALAEKMGWTPRVSQAAAAKLNQRISFDLKNASTDQLLDAAVKPAGLKYRLQGDVLEIRAADER